MIIFSLFIFSIGNKVINTVVEDTLIQINCCLLCVSDLPSGKYKVKTATYTLGDWPDVRKT
jgi:hypothetical protein